MWGTQLLMTKEARRGVIGSDHIPMTIQDESGVRLMQHSINCLHNHHHLRDFPLGFFVQGRKRMRAAGHSVRAANALLL
jgi:hypothetical protein